MEWSPREVLRITHPSTCAGFAVKKRRRCEIRLAACKKEAAEKLLNDISVCPMSDEGEMLRFMETLASYLLCPQWHEDQASRLIGQWKIRILSSRKAKVMKEMQDSSRELEDITAKLGRASLSGTQPSPSLDRSATRNPVTLPREERSTPGDASSRFKVSGLTFGCIDDFRIPTPNPRSSAPQHQSRHRKSTASIYTNLNTSSPRVSTPAARVTPKCSSQTRESVPDVKKDCPICLETTKDDRYSVTRCPGCLGVFHGSCVTLWTKECITNGGKLTCPFW